MNIYLAIPYSGMEEESFRIANEVAHKLMTEGHIVYSPITHNHPIAKAHGLPTGWDFWEKFDTEFIKWCDCIMFIRLGEVDGWLRLYNSKGCRAELAIAEKLGKKIDYYQYKF